VLTANVQVNKSARLHDLMRQQLPILRKYEGLVYVKLARRMEGPIEQVVLIEEWRDAQSLYAWTGPHVEMPRLLPGSSELIDDLSIVHYEALDIDVTDDVAEILAATPTSTNH
jgi:hypothetical protein